MNRNAEIIVAQIKQIPTFPQVITIVLNALDDEKMSAGQISELIEKEPALATNLLRLANSSFYGFFGQINTVREAIVIVGLREVKNLVLATMALRFYTNSLSNTDFSHVDLWRHSAVAAFIAKMLAKEISFADPNGSAMVGSLIHDIGKVIIDQYFHEVFVKVIHEVCDNNMTFPQAEKKVFGYTHAQIGATLLKRWNFPEELVSSVLFHHTPWQDSNTSGVSALVFCADLFAKFLSFPSYSKEAPLEPSQLTNKGVRDFLAKNGFPSKKEDVTRFLRIARNRLEDEGSALFSIFSPGT